MEDFSVKQIILFNRIYGFKQSCRSYWWFSKRASLSPITNLHRVMIEKKIIIIIFTTIYQTMTNIVQFGTFMFVFPPPILISSSSVFRHFSFWFCLPFRCNGVYLFATISCPTSVLNRWFLGKRFLFWYLFFWISRVKIWSPLFWPDLESILFSPKRTQSYKYGYY